MLLVAAKTILTAVAGFFLILGLTALIRPSSAKRFLLGFATSAPKHYLELATRFVVGGAMLLVAPHSAYSSALAAFGWLLIATTVVMTLVPWRVHYRFAAASVPKALRFLPMIGISSLVLGGLLLWALFTASAA
jgi:hypothetical protein